MKKQVDNGAHGYSEGAIYQEEIPETKNIFKPILFSTEMVQAILAGRKTQTRRVLGYSGKCVKCGCTDNDCSQCIEKQGSACYWIDIDHLLCSRCSSEGKDITSKYKTSDILWVKETTKVGAWREDESKIAFDYKASPELKNTPWCYFEEEKFEKLHLETIEALDKKGFEANIDEEREYCTYHWETGESPLNWKPSLFMPKEAARIFLKVKNVRCERLLDMFHADARDEGVEFIEGKTRRLYYDYLTLDYGCNELWSFKTLWDKINGKKHPWKSNPWVWVHEFERIEKPLDFLP